MRIAMINLGNFGSTGTIMKNIGSLAESNGHEVLLVYPDTPKNVPDESNHIIICSSLNRRINEKLAYMTGYRGVHAFFSTKRFIRKLKRFSPEIIHLHNLHNNYINIPQLFRYIKKQNIRVVWTLHDCWAFTGQCPYFTIAKCEKWKEGCHKCPQLDVYPRSKRDRSKEMWLLKKKWFTGVEDMTIVTPSHWLADLVRQSFLKEYPVQVINNGINLEIFKPIESDFSLLHACQNKKVLLGVAFDWGKRKGLDVFIELAKKLSDEYQIVLVGTNDSVDEELPDNIISIHRTANQTELAKLYSAADLFVNPTREENYPTVNMESLACGTPVITFKTGGSPESLDETCGRVVECDDIENLKKEIIRIVQGCLYTKEACLKRAETFEMKKKFEEYISLYDDIVER